jgi:Caspase domain
MLALVVPDSVRAEIPHLHALLVFDTDASNIGKSIETDKRNIRKTLLNAFEHGTLKGRCTSTALVGKNATWENIRNYYQTLNINKGDTLFFYYSGHGNLTSYENQQFSLSHDELPTYRFSVSGYMDLVKGAGLRIILADCCSSMLNTRFDPGKSEYNLSKSGGVANEKLINQLFFGHHGWVIIQSSELAKPSLCNPTTGGYFTSSFLGLLCADFVDHDENDDDFVDWKEFFPGVMTLTRRCTNDKQTPESFYLGEYRRHEYLIKFHNKTDERVELKLRYGRRGAGVSKYLRCTLNPGKKSRLQHNGNLILTGSIEFHAKGKSTGRTWFKGVKTSTGTYPVGIGSTVSYNAGRNPKYFHAKRFVIQ